MLIGTGGERLTARVNGRTVRLGYVIQNGDVLTPLYAPASSLNSKEWAVSRRPLSSHFLKLA